MRPLRCSMRRGVPWDVEMEEVGAVVLEVHAFAGGVRSDQNAQGWRSGEALKAFLISSRRPTAGTALIGGDALFGAVGLAKAVSNCWRRYVLVSVNSVKIRTRRLFHVPSGLKRFCRIQGISPHFGIGQAGVGEAARLTRNFGHTVEEVDSPPGRFAANPWSARLRVATACSMPSVTSSSGRSARSSSASGVLSSVRSPSQVSFRFSFSSNLLHALPVNPKSGVEGLDGRKEAFLKSRDDQIRGGLLRATAAFEPLIPQGAVLGQEPHQREVGRVFGQP